MVWGCCRCSAALPDAFDRKASLGGGGGRQRHQADQPHQLFLSFCGGISVLAT